MRRVTASIASRTRQLRRILAAEGTSGVARRVGKRIGRAAGADEIDLPLHGADVADSTRLVAPAPASEVSDRPLRIGWVTTPPSAGSGGHTTMLRIVEGLERAGHANLLALYDVYGGDAARHGPTVGAHWPGVRADVVDVDDAPADIDVWIATSWQTAHVLASRPALGGRRMYFVQDFEPYFYPRGALAALAEDTYRFGFTGITAGAWLSDLLERDYGMECDHFEFGADTSVYRARETTGRDGVVFYTKPTVARRGHELGILALARFAAANPDVPIHLVGDPVRHVPFAHVAHGRVSPTELDRLYNRCRVGLSLSFTNVSLIPWELLASGVVPIVNDAEHNRRVLTARGVHWASASPGALADAISEAYESYDERTAPGSLALAVAEADWARSADVVAAAIERRVRG